MPAEEDIKCCICGAPTEEILLDEKDKPPLQFCSDAHLGEYVMGKVPITVSTGVSYTLARVDWDAK